MRVKTDQRIAIILSGRESLFCIFKKITFTGRHGTNPFAQGRMDSRDTAQQRINLVPFNLVNKISSRYVYDV